MKWPTSALPDDGRVEFAFHGHVDEATSALLIAQMERRLANSPLHRKVMRVVIELVQNLHHHSPADHSHESRFLCVRRPNAWVMSTANVIASDKAQALRERIDQLSALNADELRAEHREHLSNGNRTAHGGGGVGLLEIHRKSSGEVHLEFLPSLNDSQLSVFTAEIHFEHG